MAFLQNLTGKSSASPQEAAVIGAVAALASDGELTDLERRIVSLFRDQFPPLSHVDEPVFEQILNRAIDAVHLQGAAVDVNAVVQGTIAPAITGAADRLAAYKYVYAAAMADLVVDAGEAALLAAMRAVMGIDTASAAAAENEVLVEFRALHNALAATVLGLIVVTADGKAQPEELEDVRNARALLEPIARLDDTQFLLIYDLSLNIHDRYLIDPNNRKDFLNNIVAQKLDTPALRSQAFSYAAYIATSDSDMAQSEADTLKDLLAALRLNDAEGEAIFNKYMGRIKTIDGRPVGQ